MNTPPEIAAQAVALLQAGNSQRTVARQLNMTRSTVQNVFRRFLETGRYVARAKTGRPRATSARDDRYIRTTSLRNRMLNAAQLKQQLRDVRGVTVSRWTVRRRLLENRQRCRKPATCQKLTAAHRAERLRFAREHVNWTLEQWSSVLFSDETRICLYGSDRRARVYRRQGERFAKCCIMEQVAFGGGSCMFWRGISLHAKTELAYIPTGNLGGLTAQRYIDEVLDEHVVPYAGFIGDNFLLMQDNARPHTAEIVQNYLNEVGVRTMGWPAKSPDMNPIEHMWDELKKRIRSRVHAPTTLRELTTAAQEEWDNIPQDVVEGLIRSMPNRMLSVIQARGGHTKY